MKTLDIQTRDMSVSLEDIRAEGKMPAVYYGKKTEATPIVVSRNDFIKVWREVGESGVVTLKNGAQSVDTLIKSVDMDPRTDGILHADFYVFEKGKKIEISVPLEFVGNSPAVKDLGGSLVKVLHEIKISADPQHIPSEITVDVSSLVALDSQILAGDIKLPAGVTLIENPEEVVAFPEGPKSDEPEESAPVDLSAIEVEKKGKKEEEPEA
jgi:large subunit ribosomal protein L25